MSQRCLVGGIVGAITGQEFGQPPVSCSKITAGVEAAFGGIGLVLRLARKKLRQTEDRFDNRWYVGITASDIVNER